MRLRPCVMARPSLRPKEGRWFFPELIELFSPLPSSFSLGPNLDRNRPGKGKKNVCCLGGGGKDCFLLEIVSGTHPTHPTPVSNNWCYLSAFEKPQGRILRNA